VGGGYRKTECEWSDVALDWMATEARDCGLRLHDWPRPPGSELPDSMIHNSIRNGFALALPSGTVNLGHNRNPRTAGNLKWRDYVLFGPRAELTSPPPEARLTFEVHDTAIPRLFTERFKRYRFLFPWVNECLRSVDTFTLRMISLLGGVDPGPERIAAIAEFWSDERRDSDSFWEDPAAFVNARGRPTDAEGKAFVRALFFQLVTGRARLDDLEAAIRKAVAESRAEFYKSNDMMRAEDLIARLSEIDKRVRGAIPVFPDAVAPRLESFCGRAKAEGEILQVYIRKPKRSSPVLKRKKP
jgi:hypothetical protein